MKVSFKKETFLQSTSLIRINRNLGALLLFFLFALPAFGQTIQVRGRVVNDAGQPVEKVSVILKDSDKGTVTNANGEYEISAPSNGTLIFTSINFVPQEIIVNGRTSINVTLSPSSRSLDEVIVVGYGTQRKRDVTGSIVSISELALREVPVANLQQALQGRAAGVEVQRTGTSPGAGSVIRIRGMRSILGSNDPLFVVDGIPFQGSLSDINPDDVASIDVLKDASATAIYGSRGANGVILVTTKRGRTGETRVYYNGYYGISNVANKYPVFNADEYRAMRDISTWGAGYMPEELASIASGRTTDWQDLMYETAMRTDHNFSVSGGAAGNSFSLGGGYYKETAVLPGQDFKRYSMRGSIDSRVGNRIKIGFTTLNQVSTQNGSQFVNGGSMFPILAMSPLMPAYNDDGTVKFAPNGNLDDNNVGTWTPLLLKNNNNNWVDRIRRLSTFNNIYGELQIIKGLRYRINVGLNFRQEERAQFQSGNTATNPSFFRGLRGNTALVRNSEAWDYTVENLLYYDKTIAGKHRISFTGLYSVQEYKSHYTQVAKDSITEDFVQFYNMAQASPTPPAAVTGGESSWGLLSYMARLNYTFDDRYMATITARVDGSSRLAEGKKWTTYPAVSVGWNITNESFMQNIKHLDNLKLRVGVGTTSNQSVAPYTSLGLVSNTNGLTAPGDVIRYNYGPTIVTGYNIVSLPNPFLEWELTNTMNIGLDFSLFRNRLTGSIDYYSARTTNVLNTVVLPATSGVPGAFLTNIGNMSNKGMELTLTSININSKSGFSWSTDLNLFFNNNKITRLSNGVKMDIGSQLFEGHSLTAIYDYNKLGIWQLHEAALAAQYGSVPGQIKLEDFSGPDGKPDGNINPLYDRHVLGDMDADLQGGMTHRFSYKGFDLSAVFYARFGGLLVSQVHQPLTSYLTVMDGKRSGIKVDYWTPTNASNWFPMPQPTISPISTAWTTLGYYKASFVKVRSINLGYTFNPSMLRRISAQSLRLYVTVDNVGILFSPYYKQTGIDPEGTGQGSQGVSNPGNLRNNDNGNGAITIGTSTPPTRTFTIGANISF